MPAVRHAHHHAGTRNRCLTAVAAGDGAGRHVYPWNFLTQRVPPHSWLPVGCVSITFSGPLGTGPLTHHRATHDCLRPPAIVRPICDRGPTVAHVRPRCVLWKHLARWPTSAARPRGEASGATRR